MNHQSLATRLSSWSIVLAFISFFPLFFWRNNRPILMIASVLTWIAMTYTGLLATFGSESTVLALMWQGRNRTDCSPGTLVLMGRIFGVAMILFMIFMIYEIFRGGLQSAYTNFGR